ncbi:F0F1 ATP synthase subunit gamma [uncultured Paraglaciecola sp.]|uniref:F0F1 ATP synthase subunit gamma n=1 Tax=uncultured Paraglaciecola sp. TaxID=1765024 RepID=UPI0030D8A9B9|tara:strand:- start:137574 stop:138473 length:900 start_codon:yes stop_codon:yes gene_type:complete
MSNSLAKLQHKISSARDLQSVVRTMKAMAAVNITQYENAVDSLGDYYQTIILGLNICFHQTHVLGTDTLQTTHNKHKNIGVLAFGSDQGLVGQFNNLLSEFLIETMHPYPENKIVWAIGERIQPLLLEAKMNPAESYQLPTSLDTISDLVGELILEIEWQRENHDIGQIIVFHNTPTSKSTYAPTFHKLLPFDQNWKDQIMMTQWPTKSLPELLNDKKNTFKALISEYLFVSIYKACAESLASENASRLEAMLRAEKNIEDLLDGLNQNFRHMRQTGIDEELFDLVAGYEVLITKNQRK